MNTLKRFFLLIIITVCWEKGNAQSLESLLRLEQSPLPAERHQAYTLLGKYYDKQGASLKASDYWTKCLSLEKEIYGSTQTLTAFGAAESLYKGGLYAQAITSYKTLLQRFTRNEDSTVQFTSWMHCIDAAEKVGHFQEALDMYLIVLNRFAIVRSPVAYVSQLNHMGVLEKKRQNLPSAYDYLTNARIEIQSHSAMIPAALQREVYSNLAVTHAAQKEYLSALNYYQLAEALQPITAEEAAQLYNLRGATYLLLGRYEDAQKVGIEAVALLEKNNGTLSAQQTLSDSYELLSRLYKDRDWPTYQQYHSQYLAQREKINTFLQSQEEEKLRQSIEVEKRESELRSKIANDERVANETRQKELESESANRTLELKVRGMEMEKQTEDLKRFQLEKQLLIRRQTEQQLLLEKQRLENNFRQKELDQQELVQDRGRKELQLVRSQKLLIDRQLADAKSRTRFVIWIAILAGVLILLALIGVITLLRNRRKLIQGTLLIGMQKKEIENQNDEIRKTITRLETAQRTIETQNKKLTTYNETLAQQVEERTQQLVETNSELISNNQQLEQYSYMTAHNLRGPIARLLGLTAIFGKLGDDGDREIVDKIQKEAGSLDTLIKDLNKILQVRKATEELSQVIEIGQSIQQGIRILENEILENAAKIEIDLRMAATLVFVPTYFENIIYNLVSNAIKYRHPDRPLIIRITSYEEAKFIGITVEDNGLGIDLEKNKTNLFGLYKRFHTHKDGKGIGLYLIKAQMETLGGSISVDSKVNHGTRFTLLFRKDKQKSTPVQKTVAITQQI